MTEFRYSQTALRADYLRAGVGAALTLGPLAAVPATSVAGAVLAGLGGLFVVFGVRTWLRQRTDVLVTDQGVTLRAMRTTIIQWRDMTGVELRYYTTRRDRTRGWMQLTLRSRETKMHLESTLDMFERIAEAASHAARENGIALSPSTLENLRALGIRLPAEQAEEAVHSP